MVKNSCRSTEKTDLKKGAWSAEEDRKLINYIKRYKIWNWSEMSKAAGLARSGKSCRLRWVNYLRPDIKHGNFSNEEVETIITLHESLGNRWASIAARLPGRTDNEVKNFWHTHLKKRLNNKGKPSTSSTVILVDDELSPTSMSESAEALFSPPEPEKEEIAPKFDITVGNFNITIESPQPMSTDDFSSPPIIISQSAPIINCENISNHDQQNLLQNNRVSNISNHDQQNLLQNNSVSTMTNHDQQNLLQNNSVSTSTNTYSAFETLGQPQSSMAQQEQVQMVGDQLLDQLRQSSLLSSFFEPDSLVAPSTNELMWQHDSTWTYERFCEDVCNDIGLDYMDPIF